MDLDTLENASKEILDLTTDLIDESQDIESTVADLDYLMDECCSFVDQLDDLSQLLNDIESRCESLRDDADTINKKAKEARKFLPSRLR